MTCEDRCRSFTVEEITQEGDKVMTCNKCQTRHRHTKSIEINGKTVEKRDSIDRGNWKVSEIKVEPRKEIIIAPFPDPIGGRAEFLTPEEFEEEYL